MVNTYELLYTDFGFISFIHINWTFIFIAVWYVGMIAGCFYFLADDATNKICLSSSTMPHPYSSHE